MKLLSTVMTTTTRRKQQQKERTRSRGGSQEGQVQSDPQLGLLWGTPCTLQSAWLMVFSPRLQRLGVLIGWLHSGSKGSMGDASAVPGLALLAGQFSVEKGM